MFVATSNVSASNRRKLQKLGTKLLLPRFSLIEIPATALSDMMTKGHISPATYGRFLVTKLLPPTMRHVLYLDSDTLVLKELGGLLDRLNRATEGGQTLVWACPEPAGGAHLEKLGVHSGPYFNAGVMLFDLEQWREKKPDIELFRLARENDGRFPWWSQDPLNIVLQGHWKELPSSFNVMRPTTRDQEAAVVHFAGSQKPWDFASSDPYVHAYRKYRARTGFSPFIPARILRGLWNLVLAKGRSKGSRQAS